MKKKLFFLIIILLYLYTINIYFPKKISNNIKSQFYLIFREKIEYLNVNSENLFLPIYQIEKIAGDNFYIEKLTVNLFRKRIKILNGIFSDSFKEKVLKILKDINYFSTNFKVISIINSKLIYSPYEIKKLNGKIWHKGKKFFIDLSGFVEKKPFSVQGEIFKNSNVHIFLTLKETNLNYFFTKILRIHTPTFLSTDNLIDINLEMIGKIENITNIKFTGVTENKEIKFKFNLEKNLHEYIFTNGKIQFFGEDDNYINFLGKILNDDTWSFIFKAKRDYLKIPYGNSFFKFSNINFNYSINNMEGNEIDILKLYASDLEGENELYNIFNYFFNKKNYSYSIFIDSLKIDNITISNLDVSLNGENGIKSIDKFNFDIGKGKVLFSNIKKRNSIFRVAISLKNVSIKDLSKFLLKRAPTIDGITNLTFLGFGKGELYNTGKGILNLSNLKIKNISFQELNSVFINHDIKNIPLFINNSDNSTDNSSLNIYWIRTQVEVKNHKIKLKNIYVKSDKFTMNLNGEVEPNNFSNTILSGKYISSDTSADIIINLNLKEKFLQFIGK